MALARYGALPARLHRRELTAALGLAALLLGGSWIAFGAASSDLIVDTANADEPSWLTGPLSWLGLPFSDLGFSLAIILMFAGYLVVLVCGRELRARHVLPVLGALSVLFTLTTPILSSDLFGYVGYARLGVLHHLNPYTHGVLSAPRDPILPLVYWQHPSSPYGPLFTAGSYALGARSLPFAVWSLKLLAGASCIGATVLAARYRGARAAVLIGGNPLLLIYGLGGAHNDLLVLVLVTAALSLLQARRGVAAGSVLAAAVAVKVTAGLALLFLLGRRTVLQGAVVVGLPIVAGTLLAFGPHVLDTIAGIGTQSAFDVSLSGPDLLGRLLGSGVTSGVRLACDAGVLGVVGICLLRRLPAVDTAGWTALAVVCAIPSSVPWYIAWVLPMAAFSTSRALRATVLAFTAIVIALHLPLLGFPESE